MKPIAALVVAAVLLPMPAPLAAAGPLAIVAAENFYGDVAKQIGGGDVAVTSILSSPDQDPHLFEASPSTARAVAAARIAVYNGLGYDPWAEKLLAAARRPDRTIIIVADLVGRKAGDNPHIWYDLPTIEAFAGTLTASLARADPAHAAGYEQRLAEFRQSLRPIAARITGLRRRLAGAAAAATEPVFGYMLDALGLRVGDRRFQLAVMNDTEPSASDIAAFEDELKAHRVRFLVYNRQASGPIARRMVALAEASGVPVVAVSETEPPGTSYQAWVNGALDDVERATAQ